MANRINKPVKLNVHIDFFEKVFEPERRRLERLWGKPISQMKFTEHLVRSNAIKVTYPKTIKQKRGRVFSIF